MSARCSLDRPGKLSHAPTFPSPAFYWRRLGAGSSRLQAGFEPGPGNIGPCAAIEARCAYRGPGGKGEHGMGLGNGGPHAGSGLAVSLAEQLMRLRGKFLR